MTRYLCVDARHERDGEVRPVDVTAQVRLERALTPRTSVYLAATERVVREVRDLPPSDPFDRALAIRRILTGTPEPADAPVMLMSEHAVGRSPGLYELDDLRRTEPAVERLTPRLGDPHSSNGASDDFVLLDDEGSDGLSGEDGPRRPSSRRGLLTRPAQRARIIPQGVFSGRELSERLAQAPADEGSLLEAIRSMPALSATNRGETVDGPWRVVVQCPVAEGDPPLLHDTVFTGMGEPESTVVYGTPAGGWDATLERAAGTDLDPAAAVSRAERRMNVLLLAEVLVAAVLLVVAWWSGSLALAARVTPGWLGLALALGLGAIVFAAVPLFSTSDPQGNPNDTFVVSRYYGSRLEMLRWSAMISAALFALALITGLVPPILAARPAVPAASVAFDATRQPVTATARLAAGDVSPGETMLIEMREFALGDPTGTTIGHATASASASGHVDIAETVALTPGARYLAVQVSRLGSPTSPCTPQRTSAPGCTVVSVPTPPTTGTA